MTTVAESTELPGSSDKAAGLAAALNLLSLSQQFTFKLYVRLVLPIDGFVFWVPADTLTPKFIARYVGEYNTAPFNVFGFNGTKRPPPVLTPVQESVLQFNVNGSLHLSQEIDQGETGTPVIQSVMFTTTEKVQPFGTVAPGTMYMTTLDSGQVIGFGEQRGRYLTAGLWHYHGNALYSTMKTQIVSDPRQIQPTLAIVSNSLPFWLSLSTPAVPVLPSFLAPLNQAPPYITADVQNTDAIGSAPSYDSNTSQTQLVEDRIRFTMYGLNNNAALDFQMAVLEGSWSGTYGIMNSPIPQDEKQTQREFQIIAQKKTMELRVNYYQSRVRTLAQQFILKAIMAFNPTPYASPIIPDIGQ